MIKQSLRFVASSTAIYALVYLVVGAVAYQLITKQFYVGDDPIFTAYLRSESNPAEWAHTNLWIIPGLLLRAFLISLVLLPFVGVLKRWPSGKEPEFCSPCCLYSFTSRLPRLAPVTSKGLYI